MLMYLRSDPVYGISGIVESLEKVISPPFYYLFNVVELPSSFIFGTVFYYTPAQHGHGKRGWEVELDSISSIIIATHQVFVKSGRIGFAIIQTGAPSPRDIIMLWQFPGCDQEGNFYFYFYFQREKEVVLIK